MRDLNLVQAGLGAVALMIGLAILVAAIRSGAVGESPRATAMLIGGMMLATFGLLMAAFAFYVFRVDPFWAKIAVVCAALPLGATAFVLAQRYRLLEAETSTGAVVSTAASLLTVSLVMGILA